MTSFLSSLLFSFTFKFSSIQLILLKIRATEVNQKKPEDLTHCLVYIIAADKVSWMNQKVFKKMTYIDRRPANWVSVTAIHFNNLFKSLHDECKTC